MTISFHSGGAWRTASDLWIHDTGAWRRISALYRNVGGTWHQVHAIASAPPLALTVAPAYYSATRDSTTTGGSFAKDFVATPSGGAGGYTGSWTRLSVGPTPATATGNTTPTLHLVGSWGQHANTEFSETWRYNVTDANDATAYFDITLYVSVTDNR